MRVSKALPQTLNHLTFHVDDAKSKVSYVLAQIRSDSD